MAKTLRPIGHEDRLSIVADLDELRSRMMVCGAVLLFAFFICFWQNHALLHVLNRALPKSGSVAQQSELANLPRQSAHERAGLLQSANALGALAQPGSGLTATGRTEA